jgi:hypothetical protein
VGCQKEEGFLAGHLDSHWQSRLQTAMPAARMISRSRHITD